MSAQNIATRVEVVSSDLARSQNIYHFATLFAANPAAIHLLISVDLDSLKKDYLSSCLVTTDDTIGYHLNLHPRRSGPYGHWRIGAGWNTPTAKRLGNSGVDFLLCPPGNGPGAQKARKSISSHHAVITFHLESGCLLLRNLSDKPIVCHGGNYRDKTILKTGGDGQIWVLFQQQNWITFGDYKFCLVFRQFKHEQQLFKLTRDILLTKLGGHPSSLLSIPQASAEICGNIWQQMQVSRTWATGILLHTGVPIAFLNRRYHPKSRRRIQREIATLRKLEGKDGVLSTISIECEYGEVLPCSHLCIDSSDEKSFYYIFPLEAYNFTNMPWSELPLQDRERYCYDTLIGLKNLHNGIGIFHGRIRPSSLKLLPDQLVRSNISLPTTDVRGPWELPMRGVISDFLISIPRMNGPEVAPEIYAKQHGTIKSDIWSLAVSWIHAFSDTLPISHVKTQEECVVLRTWVEKICDCGKISADFRDHLLLMLQMNPSDRVEVEDLLLHRVWAPFKCIEPERLADQWKRRVHFQSITEQKRHKLGEEIKPRVG